MVLNYFVRGVCLYWRINIFKSLNEASASYVNSMEVVVLALIKVRQVPEYADVFKCQVVPFICIWVVWNLVVVDVLSTSPGACQFYELPLVDLIRSAAFISVFCGDPSSINDDCSSIDFDRVSLVKCIFEGKTTTFITIERVDNVEAFTDYTVDLFSSWDKHFFGHVELTDEEVGLKSVVDVPLLFRHTPPGEVHLLPGSAVSDHLIESVVGF